MAMLGAIQWQVQGSVATVTLSNPQKMNAMTRAMWRQLREAFQRIQAHRALRCVLVQGAGDHFCAGGDIAEYPSFRFDPASLRDFHEEDVWGALQAMLDCPVPLLALIRGNCMGAGLEIASACDLRLAGQGSRFGAPIARLGFPMAPREADLVQRAIGATAAHAMLLAAEIYEAQRLPCGFLTWCLPDEALEEHVQAVLKRMAQLSPQAAQLNKAQLQQGVPRLGETPDSAYAYADSPEHREGIEAFLVKRPALF